MADQTSSDGSNTPSSNSKNNREWFYFYKGERKGPVTANEIQSLLASKELRPEDQIWREGLSEWVAIRSSELRGFLGKERPPLSAKYISNGLVWLVAVLPVIFGLFDLYLAQLPDPSSLHGFKLALLRTFPDRSGPWKIEVLASALLCVWDESNVRKAGYNWRWMTTWAFFIYPVYLFLRAKYLAQWPTYAIAWLIIWISAAVAPETMLGGVMQFAQLGNLQCDREDVVELLPSLSFDIIRGFRLEQRYTNIASFIVDYDHSKATFKAFTTGKGSRSATECSAMMHVDFVILAGGSFPLAFDVDDEVHYVIKRTDDGQILVNLTLEPMAFVKALPFRY